MGSQAPLGKGDLFKTPGADLPGFVREVARALMRNGKPKSQAIAIAISQIKRWAAGGGGVNADTQAKASRALAQWEAAKAKARATPNKSDLSNPLDFARPQEDGAKKERKADQSKLPPGATGWKHGWIPVDSSGKAVGPAQKPAWFRDAEAKHKAAGGRSADAVRAEKLENAQDARARKAEAPAKKAEAAKKRAEAETRRRDAAAKRKADMADRERARKQKDADRAAETKAKARDAQVKAAYKQAIADRRNGRELSDQQRRVVAYVEARQRKEQGKLRRVDVPGMDASKVAKTAPARKGAVPTPDARSDMRAVVTAPRPKKKVTVTARSWTTGLGNQNKSRRRGGKVTLTNEGDVNGVLEFAGKFPKGQLAFRYKHGWILINPAIPSRGSAGGGLARRHGVKSGSVTHGHFEPAAGGKKKFVPDRSGGENNPAKLKAAHLKNVKGAPNNKDAYTTAAAQKDSGGSALNPVKPTPEVVKAKKDAATKAAITAQKSKSLADAQVAAKRYADAFVAQKKAGDTTGAENSKNSAQAWAKKAQQIKQAEKASADAKAKYEAEQKAKAKADADAAEKAKADAEKAASEKKKQAAQKADEITKQADALYSDAVNKKADSVPEMKAKAQQYKYAADKYAELEKHAADNGLTMFPSASAKKKAAEQNAAEFAKKAVEKKKAVQEAQQLATDAYDASDDAAESQTAEGYKLAAHAHQKAGKAFQALGMEGEKAQHFDKAVLLMQKHHAAKKAEDAAKAAATPPAAPKAQTAPKMAPNPEKEKLEDGILSALQEVDEEPGALGDWESYLKAAYTAKKDPTPDNLNDLVAKQKILAADGVSPAGMQKANSKLFQSMGLTKPPAKKKTAAEKAKESLEKKAAAEKEKAKPTAIQQHYKDAYKELLDSGQFAAAAKLKAGAIAKGHLTEADFPAAPAPKAEDYKVTLPGPGMYADGNAIIKAFDAAKAEQDPAKAAAKFAAAGLALDAFKAKHGVEFKTDKVEKMTSSAPAAPFVPQGGDHVSEHPFYASAKAEGYKPVPNHTSANNGWKPSDVPGLKSSKGAYTYSGGSYTAINAHLRSGGDPLGGHYGDTVAQMDKEFAAVPVSTEPIVTTRKMNGKGPFNAAPPYMDPGGVFQDLGYSSTAKDPAVWDGDVHMQVRIPAGTPILDLNHTVGSQNSSEQEILLNRGTKYKVISDGPGHSPGVRLIVVEVVA